MIFQGRTGELLEKLATKMLAASENLDFEQAATIRDQIRGLQALKPIKKSLYLMIPYPGTRSL